MTPADVVAHAHETTLAYFNLTKTAAPMGFIGRTLQSGFKALGGKNVGQMLRRTNAVAGGLGGAAIGAGVGAYNAEPGQGWSGALKGGLVGGAAGTALGAGLGHVGHNQLQGALRNPATRNAAQQTMANLNQTRRMIRQPF